MSCGSGARCADIRNRSLSYGSSFHNVDMWQGWLRGSASEYDVPDLDRSFNDPYRRAVGHALGVIPRGTARYNYELDGTVIPVGTPLARTFGNEEYEFYGQDTWKVGRSLTLSFGLRYLLAPPVRETNGVQVSLNQKLGEWGGARYDLGKQGLPQYQVPPLVYVRSRVIPADSPIYPYHKKNLAPRFSLAWSPSSDDGWLRKLTGGPGKTSIRAGFGVFYDQLGQPICVHAEQCRLVRAVVVNHELRGNSQLDDRAAIHQPLRYTSAVDPAGAAGRPSPGSAA